MSDAFKREIRARMADTGESYMQARRALLAEREEIAAIVPQPRRVLTRGGRVVGTVTMLNTSRAELHSALARFGTPTELLTAFNADDLVFKAGLSPAQFPVSEGYREGTTVDIPSCLLANDRSEWLGVDGPMCGYPGTGPRNTIALLEYLGVRSTAATEAVRCDRYVRVDLASGDVVDRSHDPVSHVSLGGQDLVCGMTIVRLMQDNPFIRGWLDPAPGSDYDEYVRRHNGGGNTLRSWCDEVLHVSDPPAWATGPARARYYLNFEAVRRAGLDRTQRGRIFHPTLVIEQGDVQLWCPAGMASGHRVLLSEDAERALQLVGLPAPSENWAQRLLRVARGRGASPYLEISEDGRGLRHDPSELANLIEVKRLTSASFPRPPVDAVRRSGARGS